MGSPSPPKAAAVAAAPKQSSLDIRRTQMEAEDELRRRRGFMQSQFAGTGGGLATNSLG